MLCLSILSLFNKPVIGSDYIPISLPFCDFNRSVILDLKNCFGKIKKSFIFEIEQTRIEQFWSIFFIKTIAMKPYLLSQTESG